MNSRRRDALTSRQVLWLASAALGLSALVGVAFLPPFLEAGSAELVMAGYRKVCHQLPSRSFQIDGTPAALCHRCTGIWGAAAIAVTLFAGLRRFDGLVGRSPGVAIVLSLVPLAVDWVADFLGFWDNTAASRLTTGAIFGITAGYFLARVIVKSVRRTGENEHEPSRETASQRKPDTRLRGL